MQESIQTSAAFCFLKHMARACFVAVAVLRPSELTVGEVSEISSKELLGGLHRPDLTDSDSSPGESVAVLTPNQTATHGHTSGQSLPNHLRPCPMRRRHGLGCSHTAPGHSQGVLAGDGHFWFHTARIVPRIPPSHLRDTEQLRSCSRRHVPRWDSQCLVPCWQGWNPAAWLCFCK